MTAGDGQPTLTLGVIARDGERFIDHALDAIALLFDLNRWSLNVILVDSASKDRTLEKMQAFAQQTPHTRVFALSGEVNASVARNVILDNITSGHAFMIDGDVAVNAEFIDQAVAEFDAGSADAIYGQLPEIWHDANGEPYDTRDDRYHVNRREPMRWFKGVVMLSERVVTSGIRYDLRLERLEDIEFSLKVADQFKIMTLPVPMGIHYTDGYHSQSRLRDFIKGQYQRPAGQFIRANLLRPDRLLTVKRSFIGYVVGLLMQLIVLVGLLFLSPWIIAIGLAILLIDAARFYSQGRLHEFLPLRFIGAWQIAWGLFTPRRTPGPFTINEK